MLQDVFGYIFTPGWVWLYLSFVHEGFMGGYFQVPKCPCVINLATCFYFQVLLSCKNKPKPKHLYLYCYLFYQWPQVHWFVRACRCTYTICQRNGRFSNNFYYQYTYNNIKQFIKSILHINFITFLFPCVFY